ncbi:MULTISPECIES: chemotaxis protein CheW [unclassified Halomonas]|uniref:chemotaxis protein CheW n=1 Tax=unclassified Halomonas TaxID=2609666 RepID=UPI0020767558|nr:chemotaxis protein CheW [Halomonas sp. S3-1-8]
MTTPTPPSRDAEHASLSRALEDNRVDASPTALEEPTRQLVLFRLAGQRFAFDGAHVREILSGEAPVYFVPGVARSVEGVIHLRGHIESVIALHALLGLTPSDGVGRVLLVEAAGLRTGVRIDQLDDVCDVALSALKAPPETLDTALKPFVDALIHQSASEAIVVLDADALLTAFQAGQG